MKRFFFLYLVHGYEFSGYVSTEKVSRDALVALDVVVSPLFL